MTINCADCNERFDLSVVVSSEDWERIADDGAYMLCYRCMDRRARERGMTVMCSFVYLNNLRTKDILPAPWRTQEMVSIDKQTGHPKLSGWQP
jgi:hypothetical protein